VIAKLHKAFPEMGVGASACATLKLTHLARYQTSLQPLFPCYHMMGCPIDFAAGVLKIFTCNGHFACTFAGCLHVVSAHSSTARSPSPSARMLVRANHLVVQLTLVFFWSRFFVSQFFFQCLCQESQTSGLQL
jgi:hypothetical protein